MHERNPYRKPIDFISLAEAYPPLEPLLIKTANSSVTIDFKVADAQRCLTEALLSRDFELKLTLPEGRLCPPVPNRLNYLLWIQDLLSETFRSLPHDKVIGIDIGTGSSIIYPLLGCRLEPSWYFVGTEIDPTSYASALENVKQNGFETRIHVLKASPTDPLLLPLHDEADTQFTFTMCNPPFYGSAAEVARSAEAKELEPSAVCTGAEVEMITPGGEEAFVQRMVTESLEREVGNRCLWFSSMLGKFTSVGAVVGALRAHKIDNYALAELVQGQTRRWVVAWSFTDVRIPDTLARALPSSHRTFLPRSNTLRQPLRTVNSTTSTSFRILREVVLGVLSALEGVIIAEAQSTATASHSPDTNVDLENECLELSVSAARNTWSRAARRQREKKVTNARESRNTTGDAKSHDMSVDPSPSPEPKSELGDSAMALTVDIRTIRVYSSAPRDDERDGKQNARDTGGAWFLEFTWRRGRDRALFESFCGHVCRRIGAALDLRTTARGRPGS